jgi:hypothetical protein
MLEQVEEQHKEDEERFKKLQVQDTATLNDKMDQLTVRFSLSIMQKEYIYL